MSPTISSTMGKISLAPYTGILIIVLPYTGMELFKNIPEQVMESQE